MRNFLIWWTMVTKHPAYTRARILALLSAADLGAMVYFTMTGDFGWTFPLVIVFFILSSSCLEALGYALQGAGSLPVVVEEEEDYEGDEDGNWGEWDEWDEAVIEP